MFPASGCGVPIADRRTCLDVSSAPDPTSSKIKCLNRRCCYDEDINTCYYPKCKYTICNVIHKTNEQIN